MKVSFHIEKLRLISWWSITKILSSLERDNTDDIMKKEVNDFNFSYVGIEACII